MGKRKSKSGKQKQTKKNNSNSSSLLKTGSKRKSNDIKLLCYLPKPKVAPFPPAPPLSNQQHHGPKVVTNDEKHEFNRQLKSLVERSSALNADRRKGGRKQRRRKHSEQGSMFPILKPASFSVDKSTNQLMEETMHQMGQIMSNGNGNGGHMQPVNGGGSSLARTVASIPHSERTPVASNVHKMSVSSGITSYIGGITGIGTVGGRQKRDTNTKTNSFAALGSCSDSEEDENDAEIAAATTIRFAPAAFSLGTNSTPLLSRHSGLLPTKTPPTTPNPNHRKHPSTGSSRSTSLFGTINEEEIEELHYQQQLGEGNKKKYGIDNDL